jgi:hypothetical protein
MVKLPRTCHWQEAIQKGALQLSGTLHKEILDESNQRDVLNFEEDFGEDINDTFTDGRSKGEESL